MRLIVLIKQVPDTRSAVFDEATGTLAREASVSIVNPLDLNALEVALRLVEAYGGSVSVLSMGPRSAETALREALSMGADDAHLLSDRALAGSDTWATAYALAEVVRHLGPFDMILCGEKATDGDTGQVGPMLAARLGIPLVPYVSSIPVVAHGMARLMRLVEAGVETVECAFPCLATVVKSAAEPRLPTFRGKLKARAASVEILTADSLSLNRAAIGLDGSPTRVFKTFKPKIGRDCRMLRASDEASASSAAKAVVEYLRTEGKT